MNIEALATLLDGMPFLPLTPQEKSIIVHQQFSPQKQKEKKGDNCLPAIWGWEVIQPTGKTQVFNDAKRCLILPSFSPGEWYFQSLDFSPPHCTIPEERNIFWAKKNYETLRLKSLLLTQCLTSQCWKTESGFTWYKELEGVLKLFLFIISPKQI